MTLTRRQLVRLAMASAGAIASTSTISACGPAGAATPLRLAATAVTSPPKSIRVGNVGTLAEAGQIIALGRGYFKDVGIDIAFSTFDSAPRMVAPLGTDQLDVGSGGVSAGIFNAVARGVSLKIVGPQARHDPGHCAVYLVVAKALAERGDIASYADLRGRKVAVPATGIWSDYALSTGLARAGVKLSEVELVEIAFPDMVAALASGSVSVAMAAEPTAAVAEAKGVGVKWREAADLVPGVQATVVVYGPNFARDRADLGRRWMTAYLRGVRDYHDAFVVGSRDRDAVIALLAEGTTVKDPALYPKMGYAYIDPNGEVSTRSLAEQQAWFITNGLMQTPLDLEQVLDHSFVDQAVAELGRRAV